MVVVSCGCLERIGRKGTWRLDEQQQSVTFCFPVSGEDSDIKCWNFCSIASVHHDIRQGTRRGRNRSFPQLGCSGVCLTSLVGISPIESCLLRHRLADVVEPPLALLLPSSIGRVAAANVGWPSVDLFLFEMSSPNRFHSTPRPCVPICKPETNYISYGSFKVPLPAALSLHSAPRHASCHHHASR